MMDIKEDWQLWCIFFLIKKHDQERQTKREQGLMKCVHKNHQWKTSD